MLVPLIVFLAAITMVDTGACLNGSAAHPGLMYIKFYGKTAVVIEGKWSCIPPNTVSNSFGSFHSVRGRNALAKHSLQNSLIGSISLGLHWIMAYTQLSKYFCSTFWNSSPDRYFPLIRRSTSASHPFWV
jgi:hypothetical protein